MATPVSPIVLTIETYSDQSSRRDLRMDATAGQRITFGDCAGGCCTIDARSPGMAGNITAHATHWTLANHSRHIPIRVWNAERPRDTLTIDPGQGDTAMPFDLAQLAGHKGAVMTVYGPEPDGTGSTSACAGVPNPAWGLKPTSMHYKVMLAIAEPAMNRDTASGPPTASQLSAYLHIDVRQVHEHTEYLVKKLGLARPSNSPPRDWRRHAIHGFALTHPHIPPPGAVAPSR